MPSKSWLVGTQATQKAVIPQAFVYWNAIPASLIKQNPIVQLLSNFVKLNFSRHETSNVALKQSYVFKYLNPYSTFVNNNLHSGL
jgi:hypothetical protein